MPVSWFLVIDYYVFLFIFSQDFSVTLDVLRRCVPLYSNQKSFVSEENHILVFLWETRSSIVVDNKSHIPTKHHFMDKYITVLTYDTSMRDLTYWISRLSPYEKYHALETTTIKWWFFNK